MTLTWTTAVAVAGGGAAGAVARLLVSSLAQRAGAGFPYGTLAVNLVGCLLIGLVLGLTLHQGEGQPAWRLPDAARAALLVGFLGAFTTFSTFAWETADLLMGGKAGRAALYMGVSNLAGLALVWGGWSLAGLLSGLGSASRA